MKIETLIGIAIWVVIFLVWYIRTYPEKMRKFLVGRVNFLKWPRRKTSAVAKPRPFNGASRDYKALVETVESIAALDRMSASDAASMVQAVKRLLEIEPASGQIWEAYALDSLETAHITCDECRIPVMKTVKKTGVRIHCPRCQKWLALRNSKVTVIDPNRPDLEEWEH